ncbi:hypothetical protein I4558_16970 [Proteus mirabilis]|uniref:ABC-three component system protein n=1 Tax=Proteus columbae TaxID=1987580 RepID=UPI000C1F1799|nr:ABC-three component system protein [Proteus columbae]MBG2712354.1 hypothetical protein [Proteus mirabilis]MBG2769051.1 hypothetical protein [Proteus mirabilis]
METVKSIGPRDYRPKDIRRLDTLSGNKCAAPHCNKNLVSIDGSSIVSKICHIEAASPKGPRYNSSMTNDQRRGYDNLILLCDECHIMIDNMDNIKKYPVSLLHEWKKNHEEIGMQKKATKKSMLMSAINAIANVDFDDSDSTYQLGTTTIFNIEEKISHNNIVRKKHLIDAYKVHYTKLAVLYNELENTGSFKIAKLLRNINLIYINVVSTYINSSVNYIDVIRLHADDIINDIEDELMSACQKNSDVDDGDLMYGISVIMVDAFMRCKILEEPPK